VSAKESPARVIPGEGRIFVRTRFREAVKGEEQVMGNRDKRGREKKKPKKQEIKRSSTPARPATEYKPIAPSPRQNDGETS
jgi:hypothetical protein